MSKISEIISLPVYSINDRKIVGHIENALLSAREIKFFVIYNEDDDLHYLLSPQNIYGQSDNAVTIKNNSSITLMQNEEKALEDITNPLNTTVINTLGQTYGVVKDVELCGKKITNIICDQEIDPKQLLYFSKDITMLKSRENEKISSFALRRPSTKTPERLVQIVDVAPLREVVGNNMLIGRKATQDITGINGEILIKANTTITTKTLNKIKYSGKLKELTLHSK